MAFTTPAQLLTELDAVNLVLEAKGLSSANIINAADQDIASALLALNQADLEVQSKGWSFNSDDSLTLAINEDGEIVLPDQTLSVANAYWPSTSSGRWARVVARQGKLYDRTNQTFVFTASVPVDITVRQAYEDIPQAARNYIAILAAHRSQPKGQGSSLVTRITDEQVLSALAAMEQHEDRANPQNQITGSISVVGSLFASGVRRRTNWSY